MHVAFNRSHQDLALGFRFVAFFLFDKGNQVGDRLFHYAGGFNHLWQEHFTGAKQVTDHVHAIHQGAFDDLDRALGLLACFFGIFDNPGGNTLDQRVGEPRVDVPGAPFFGFCFLYTAVAFVFVGDLQQCFGTVFGAVEHDVFHAIT